MTTTSPFTDADECQTFKNLCHPSRADCINTVGSYDCRCKSGYQGDGFNCTCRFLFTGKRVNKTINIFVSYSSLHREPNTVKVALYNACISNENCNVFFSRVAEKYLNNT